MNYIIMGAGAIGSAIAKKALDSDTRNQCIVTFNQNMPTWSHERCYFFQLDATDESQYQKLKKFILEKFKIIDVCINTIGILHSETEKLSPEKRLADFDPVSFDKVLRTNTLPTVFCAKHFDKLFSNQGCPVLAAISAKVGSIEDNRLGGWHSYRASKACLNMLLKNIAIEWSYKKKNGCVVALHPGTTDSALSKPFQKNVPQEKLFSAKQTATYLLSIIDKLTINDNGSFMGWDGSKIPW